MAKVISLFIIVLKVSAGAIFAQNVGVTLNVVSRTGFSTDYDELIVVTVFNNSDQDVYMPTLGFLGHVILKEKGRSVNWSWCYYNRAKCVEEGFGLEHRDFFMNRTDSILKIDTRLNSYHASSQSMFFIKSGEKLVYKLPLCYLKNVKGVFKFRYNNARLLRCTEHIRLNQFIYGLERRFPFLNKHYTKHPKYVLGYKLCEKILKSKRYVLHLGGD